MRSVNRLVVLSGLAALIAASAPVSMAADSADKQSPAGKTATGYKPVNGKNMPIELKHEEDRGLKITASPLVPVTPQNPVPVKVIVPTKRVVKPIPHEIGTHNPIDRSLKISPMVMVAPIPGISRPQANPQNHKRIAAPIVASKPSKPVDNPNPTKPSNPDFVKVSNTSAPFINAWLDRAGQTPKYKVGDKMVVNVSSSVDCNLVVYNYDAHGTLTQIFPNDLQKDGRVKAGQNVQIGGEESPFEYTVSGNGGLERIFVYAYPSSQSNSPMTVALLQKKEGPFRTQTNMPLTQYVAMVRDSAVFTTRGIDVVPRKSGTQKVANTQLAAATEPDQNKLELTFQVESTK